MRLSVVVLILSVIVFYILIIHLILTTDKASVIAFKQLRNGGLVLWNDFLSITKFMAEPS